MATLPMFQMPETSDAWHRVTAPGGYEVWRVEAEDEKGDVRMAAALWAGSPTDRVYRRAYERYMRRPTRQRPPVPGDCSGATVTVWRGGRLWCEISTRAEAFAASDERVEVRVGGNELVEVDGGLKLVVGEGAVAGEWTFWSPKSSAVWEGSFPSRVMTRGEHRWIVPAGAYRVEGAMRVGRERLAMSGRGYHDHWYGTGPLGEGMRRWMRGRLLLEERTVAFAVGYPRRSGVEVEGLIIEADGSGVRAFAEKVVQKGAGDWAEEVEFGARLRLRQPRGMLGNWVEYEAVAGGEVGRAVCEMIAL
jgi:hypothetical protein